MADNIVLLTSRSRESASKYSQYTMAAAKLGIEVRDYPDSHTIGVYPCTDFRAVEASNLAMLHGVPGPDPMATTIATNKALAYQHFRKAGFPTLWWHVPTNAKDLDFPFNDPIFVKPERGSGSFSDHPWAYRAYASMDDFKRFLIAEDLFDAFLEYQNDPNSWYGRYMTMEYISGGDIYTISAISGPDRPFITETGYLRFTRDSHQCEWMLLGQRHQDQETMVGLIQSLWDLGLRRSIIYIQCVEKNGRLCPIDLNLRPSTMTDLAIGKLGLSYYETALATMLGISSVKEFSWPSRAVGIRRVVLPLEAGRRKAQFNGSCSVVVEELSYDLAHPYDLGHAWPMFVVTDDDPNVCASRAEAIVKDMRLSDLQPI